MRLSVSCVSVALCCAWAMTTPAHAICKRVFHTPINDLIGQKGEDLSLSTSIDDLWLRAIITEAGYCLESFGSAANVPRRQQMLREGLVDTMAAASITPEREAYALFSKPYRVERAFLVARAGEHIVNAAPKNLADAIDRGYTIAALRGAWVGPQFDKQRVIWREQGKLMEFDTTRQALDMLQHKRVDLFIVHDQSMRYVQPLSQQVTVLPTPLYADDVQLMFSKVTVTPETVNEMNAAIARLKARHYVPVMP